MNKAKAIELTGTLLDLGFSPQVTKLDEVTYKIIVLTSSGVLVDTLKTYQDNNAVTIKARTIDII